MLISYQKSTKFSHLIIIIRRRKKAGRQKNHENHSANFRLNELFGEGSMSFPRLPLRSISVITIRSLHDAATIYILMIRIMSTANYRTTTQNHLLFIFPNERRKNAITRFLSVGHCLCRICNSWVNKLKCVKFNVNFSIEQTTKHLTRKLFTILMKWFII